MAAPASKLNAIRLWRLDHRDGALRVTKAPAGVAAYAVPFVLGLVCIGVGALGVFDVWFGAENDAILPSERTFALIGLAVLIAGGLAFCLVGWVMRDRERFYAIEVDPTGVHVRHGRFREDRIAADQIERIEVIGRSLNGPSASSPNGFRVDVVLARPSGAEPFVLAMWSLSPGSDEIRAQLEQEARLFTGQIAVYLGDKPVTWHGFTRA